MRPLLAAVALSFLLALPAQAQEMNLTGFDSIQSMLAARKGKPVTLRLSGGQELSGVVRQASSALVVLGAISGREFFDAVIPIEKIEAVLVRTK
jgi:hypothetical protein